LTARIVGTHGGLVLVCFVLTSIAAGVTAYCVFALKTAVPKNNGIFELLFLFKDYHFDFGSKFDSTSPSPTLLLSFSHKKGPIYLLPCPNKSISSMTASPTNPAAKGQVQIWWALGMQSDQYVIHQPLRMLSKGNTTYIIA
jgi:hypothetical protein